MPENYIVPISNLRNEHIGKFLAVICTVSKATDSRPRITKAIWKCMRCGHETVSYQDIDANGLQEPFAGCENETCGKKGPFKLLKAESEKIDRQFLKVQEPLENLRGRPPKYLYVTCINDLVDSAKPGDKVIITGTLEGKIKTTKDGKTPDLDFYLNANSIKKSENDFENMEITPKEEAFFKELSKRPDVEKIFANSICPSIFGYDDVKEGVAYQLFGGVPTSRTDGTTVRGDIHCLLVGDPGLAKSKLLRYVYGFAPRAVIGSGGSASGVGLTGAAVQDEFDKRWAIEAGLMTMAGLHGIVCLDEMDKMNPSDRASLHTAMEQQFIDIAKAGTFAHLPAVCGVLGAANPKYGRFDPYDSIASQFNLGDALISRFDFIFIMRDKIDADFDMKLALKVLRDEEPDKPMMDSECLRKYIAYAKMNFEPKMTEEAIDYLAPFYVNTRQSGKGKDTIPITVRTLEAAKRVAAAHAKMRLRNEITLEDAKASVALHIKNLRDVGVDPETGDLDSSVLTSGTSSSQHQRIKTLKGIIKDLQSKNLKDSTADIEDVQKIAGENGIKDTEFLLKRIREKGDIFFPSSTSVKLVK
jgi:replicative DNA helicase Mcm